MNNKLIAIVLNGFLAFSLQSCKEAKDSSVTKSLDNFTSSGKAEDFTWNDCSGGEKVTVTDDRLIGNSLERKTMREALSALPVEMQDAFFKEMNGKIAVVADINKSCNVPAGSSGIDATLSCWQPGSNNINIYIKAETSPVQSGSVNLSAQDATLRNIKHAVVRAFGFVLTDIIMKTPASADGVAAENQGGIQLRKEIGEMLVADLKILKIKIPGLYQSDRNAFEKAAFAESFDSWYCSATSRTNMNKFSKTQEYFRGVAEDLPKILRGDELAPLTSDAEPAGASLWGGWGMGNGPLRQGVANWGNRRANGGGLLNVRRFQSGGGFIFQRPWFNPARWG